MFSAQHTLFHYMKDFSLHAITRKAMNNFVALFIPFKTQIAIRSSDIIKAISSDSL